MRQRRAKHAENVLPGVTLPQSFGLTKQHITETPLPSTRSEGQFSGSMDDRMNSLEYCLCKYCIVAGEKGVFSRDDSFDKEPS